VHVYADIDYETIIMYVGGYDDMVVAKTQIRGRIEADTLIARKNRATAGIYRAVFRGTRSAQAIRGRKKSNACRRPSWQEATSSGRTLNLI